MNTVNDGKKDTFLDAHQISKYLEFYDTALGKKILEKELEFVDSRLVDSKTILSIGCGPAILEANLFQLHPTKKIVGVDCSLQMIEKALKSIYAQLGNAQHLSFKDNSFDAIMYITSLEFIKNYKKAIREAYRVLKLNGKVLLLMLNPQSTYFRERHQKNDSYIRQNIKHTNIVMIHNYVSRYFNIINKQYFLGIKNQKLVDSTDPHIASLYVLEGIKYE
jgi:ubiquinone/menaquinone biosynthesis C-methylase UbiE